MTNEYFVETLHHFTCPSCRRDGCAWSMAMEKISRTEWFCPWCGEETDFVKAINQDVLHDTDLVNYPSQIDWIEQEVHAGTRSDDYSVQWAETAENVKARSLVIDEYVKGYHGA